MNPITPLTLATLLAACVTSPEKLVPPASAFSPEECEVVDVLKTHHIGADSSRVVYTLTLSDGRKAKVSQEEFENPNPDPAELCREIDERARYVQ